ncbi:MAG TPA: Maf family protein [Spirochaetia bacterium]|nr:Maf family protein [Spirochaetia bacterium]
METITLASTSPQRREILQRLGIPFRVLTAAVDEDLDRGESPAELVETLAREKVEAVRKAYRLAGNWIVGADTVIVHDGRRVGKPRSRDEAREFLEAFSGSSHEVLTGIALAVAGNRKIVCAHERTVVHFAKLSGEDIEWYLETEEWQGAAGGYRIQVRGACLIERIDGSYTTVVGLPIHRLYGMLREHNYTLSA